MQSKSETKALPTGSRRFLKEILSLSAIVMIVLSARSTLADHYWVPTGSMRPTVEIGDRILVDKLAYGVRVPFSNLYLVEFDGPARGDVVVLESPDDGEVLLKRVVGLPGDEVQVRRGRLIVDGKELSLAPRLRLTNRGGPDFGPTIVPPGEYLVLGDNRGNSRDGRFFGFVPRETILGRAHTVWLRDSDLVWEPL